MPEIARVLYGREDIRRRIEELGRTITGDYEGRAPVLISVLKGGSIFLADLIRQIRLPLALDYMSISRYGGATESMGRVRIVKDLDEDIGGRHVIVVEDIVDTGLTLTYLLNVLESRQPASVRVCTLLDKSVRRITPVDIRYVGFDCPDVFVVGYGLDYAERYRNLKPSQYTGSIYDLFAARRGALKRAGEWNSYEITARGRHVTVVLNGTPVVDADLDAIQDEVVLKRHPGLARSSGHIGFLGHKTRVEYRNIRIKELR